MEEMHLAKDTEPSLIDSAGEESFDAIRPYNDDEVRGAIDSLLHDRQFSHILKGFVPFLPLGVSRGILCLATAGINSTLGFQLRFMKPLVKHILRRCSTGYSFAHPGIAPGPERYTFLSNHRDIVLDSAILDVMLHDDKFPTTCEIAIGDNLLIYPWIRTLVRLNKAFIVQRSLPMREMLRASQTMSHYMHYAISEKHENIWIAQREGRAKDSSDQTQVSLLKMLAIAGDEGTAGAIESIRALNVVPLAISYEFDPCDYLKAQEFQLKRDNPIWKKSKQDDLQNMKTGIFGQKGHVHYQTGCPVNEWIGSLSDLPEKAFFQAVAQRIDNEIHQSYRLYPGNYVAAHILTSEDSFTDHYTAKDRAAFETYLQQRVEMAAQGLQAQNVTPDITFLRDRIVTMYANPVFNKVKSEK